MGGLSSIAGAIGGAFGGPTGAALGLGFGSLFEESSARGLTRSQQRHQDKREDSRFQRSVKDAEAAGLHPLFALGNAGVPGPTTITGQSTTGGTPGDAIVRAAGRKNNPKMSEAQLALMESQVRLSIIDEQINSHELDRVKRSLTDRPGVVEAVLPPATTDSKNISRYAGKVEIEPAKTRTHAKGDPSSTPGKNPAWQYWDIGANLTLKTPWTDEGLEEILGNPFNWPTLFALNAPRVIHHAMEVEIRARTGRKGPIDIIAELRSRWPKGKPLPKHLQTAKKPTPATTRPLNRGWKPSFQPQRF